METEKKSDNGFFSQNANITLIVILIGMLFFVYNKFIATPDSITLEKYTIKDSVLYTSIPKYNASYEITIPKTINIKTGDKVTIVPANNEKNLYEIKTFLINDVEINSENYPLDFKEIRRRPYNW